MLLVNNEVSNYIIAFSKYKVGQIIVVKHDFNMTIKRGMMGKIIKASHKTFSSNLSRMSFKFSSPSPNKNQVVIKFDLEEDTAVRPIPGTGFSRRASDTLNITTLDELKKIRLADKQERFIFNMNGTYALLQAAGDKNE